jgi:hypothetical protein
MSRANVTRTQTNSAWYHLYGTVIADDAAELVLMAQPAASCHAKVAAEI